MFTGLIEDVGRIVELEPRAEGVRLAVATALSLDEVREGESIAVDGACLTVVGLRGERFLADVVPETLRRTTLGSARPGDAVHLERALHAGDRLGGHLVQGHVDGTARLLALARQAGELRLRVELPDALARFVASKGSIAVSGVSLTVAALGTGWFEVVLIPATIERTWLGRVTPGRRVNLEVDLVARYLERMIGPGAAERRSVEPEQETA